MTPNPSDEFPRDPLLHSRAVAKSMAELSRSIQENYPYLVRHLPTIVMLNLALSLSVTGSALLEFADEIDKLRPPPHNS